jgi:hypothetical protein
MQKKNRKTAPSGFLTAQDAMTAMGLPSTTFYNLVKDGVVTGVLLPGRKEKVYPLVDVETYRRALYEATSPYQTNQAYYFGIGLKEDIFFIEALASAENEDYEQSVPRDVLEAWIRKNPEALHVLSKGADLVGYVAMFPLPLEAIMKRLSGAYWSRTIPIDDIQPFVPKMQRPLFIAGIAVKKDDDAGEQKRTETQLIDEIAKLLARLAEGGVVFNELYAIGSSEEQIALYRALGMQPLALPEGARENRVPFKLDFRQNTASPLARQQ